MADTATDTRAAREEARTKHKEELDKGRKTMVEDNLKKMAEDVKCKPTPTPDEILAAMAGKNPDIKEPDGSPEQDHTGRVVKRADANTSDASYRTRAATPQQSTHQPAKKET
jgi:hypothetical protein